MNMLLVFNQNSPKSEESMTWVTRREDIAIVKITVIKSGSSAVTEKANKNAIFIIWLM